MLSDRAARFNRHLSLDPSLLEAYEVDPEGVLANSDLSEDDKRQMCAADRDQLRRQLPAAESVPSGVFA
jgi:hypothetical protein